MKIWGMYMEETGGDAVFFILFTHITRARDTMTLSLYPSFRRAGEESYSRKADIIQARRTPGAINHHSGANSTIVQIAAVPAKQRGLPWNFD